MLPFGEIFIATKGPNVKQIFQPSGHTAINGHLDFHLYSLFSQPCQSVRLSLRCQKVRFFCNGFLESFDADIFNEKNKKSEPERDHLGTTKQPALNSKDS